MTTHRSSRSAARSVRQAGWSASRLVSAVTGALLVLCSLGLLAAGGTALWADTTQRHGGDPQRRLGRPPSGPPRRPGLAPRP